MASRPGLADKLQHRPFMRGRLESVEQSEASPNKAYCCVRVYPRLLSFPPLTSSQLSPGDCRGLVAGPESRRGRAANRACGGLATTSRRVPRAVPTQRDRGEAAEPRRVVQEGVPSPMPPRFLQTSQPLRSYRATKPVFRSTTTETGSGGAALR